MFEQNFLDIQALWVSDNQLPCDGCPKEISGHGLRVFSFTCARKGGATRPGTEKRCSHNLQSDPLGSSFKKGWENFLP